MSQIAKDQFWAIVDKKLNPLNPSKKQYRGSHVAVNDPNGTDKVTGLYMKAVCKSADPDSKGIYTVIRNELYAKEKVIAITNAIGKPHPGNPEIIGPYDSYKEALAAQEAKRPKTDKEIIALQAAEIASMKVKTFTK
jgi:hypothetical protein